MTTSELSNPEDDLAARAARGDRQAQGEIVRLFQKKILSLCLGLVGPGDAEDLAQDTLVRVLTRIDSFRGSSDLGTWIYRVATNECLSFLRRKSRSPVQNTLEDQISGIREPDPDSGIQMSESLLRVQRAMMDLPDDQRAILVLRDVRDLDYEQLSQVFEVPIGTVRSRLFRARRALADRLESRTSSE